MQGLITRETIPWWQTIDASTSVYLAGSTAPTVRKHAGAVASLGFGITFVVQRLLSLAGVLALFEVQFSRQYGISCGA